MPTTHDGLPVHVHLAGREVTGVLSTSHASSSYGQPVLVLGGVPFGPGDPTPFGTAAALLLEPEEPTNGSASLLDRWNGLADTVRDQGNGFPVRVIPSMALVWLESGYWTFFGGACWYQGDRSLVAELDGAPLHREVVRHVTDQGDGPGVEGASWTFPDGSGVVEIGATWDVFDREGRTTCGRILRAVAS